MKRWLGLAGPSQEQDPSQAWRRAPPASSSFGSWEKGRKYGIVIDAGSSGSRLQVYSWLDHAVAKDDRLARGDSIAVLPKVEKGVESGEDWTLKVEPGISSLADNPDGVASYLAPLFEHARSIIPPSQLASTPVYLLATAGMRLLSSSQSSDILEHACRYIRKSTPFQLENCDDQVRIISGEEEGIYGWVAINYLMDGFDAHGLSSKGKGRHSSTYGFLDMGGASTQIAFEPSTEARKDHADNLLSVNLRLLDGMDVHHPVFVTTWLGYGTNQARERYVDATITQYLKEHPPDPDPDPNASQAVASGGGGEKPIRVIPDPCLPKDLLLQEPRHQGYALQGRGKFAQCLQRSLLLLNRELPCPDPPCLMGVHVPPIDFKVNHFIGISEYWYSTHDIWSLGGVYDFPTFEKSALEYCSREWESILKDHSEGGSLWKTGSGGQQKPPDTHRLEMQCFKAAWIVNVLHEGIGIPRLTVDAFGEGGRSNGTEEALKKAGEKGFASASTSTFQSVNEINNVAVSWTLGRMVLEVTDRIPKSSSSLPHGHGHDEDGATPMFEWKSTGHTSSWRLALGVATNRAVQQANPLSLLALVCFAVFFYYCTCVRGKKVDNSNGNKGGRPGFSARDEYSMLSMEQGSGSGLEYGGDAQDDGGSASPRKASTPLFRSFLPLRHLAARASRLLHSKPTPITRSSSPSHFLPITRTARSPVPPGASASPIRPTVTLRHVASSPALSRGMPPQRSTTLPSSSSASKLHIDMFPNGHGHGHSNGHTPPPTQPQLTPPARAGSPIWSFRGSSSAAGLGGTGTGSGSGGPSRSGSSRSLHHAHTTHQSSNDSDGYLSVPVGVSSTAPNLTATTWEPPPPPVSPTGSTFSGLAVALAPGPTTAPDSAGNHQQQQQRMPVTNGMAALQADREAFSGLRSRNSSSTNLTTLAARKTRSFGSESSV